MNWDLLNFFIDWFLRDERGWLSGEVSSLLRFTWLVFYFTPSSIPSVMAALLYEQLTDIIITMFNWPFWPCVCNLKFLGGSRIPESSFWVYNQQEYWCFAWQEFLRGDSSWTILWGRKGSRKGEMSFYFHESFLPAFLQVCSK